MLGGNTRDGTNWRRKGKRMDDHLRKGKERKVYWMKSSDVHEEVKGVLGLYTFKLRVK